MKGKITTFLNWKIVNYPGEELDVMKYCIKVTTKSKRYSPVYLESRTKIYHSQQI